MIDLDRNWQEFEIYWVNWCISFLYTLDDKFKLDLTASIFSIFGLTSLSWVRCGIMPPQLKNNFQYRIIILKNKPKFWQTNLVCLLEFWFVCQNFGLFVSILVCLPAFWFVCQHFGLFASILVTKLPTNKLKCRQTDQFDKTKQKKLDP